MAPYFAFFTVAAIPAAFYAKRLNAGAWMAAWTLFVLFIGLRHQVGGDWGNYVSITQTVSDLTLTESAARLEPLFLLLTWISNQLGAGVYGANFVGAIIFCAGLFAYSRTQPNPWLALTAAVPFLVVVTAMSANRQGMAIGVVLFTMAHWSQWGFRKRAIGISAAAMFHTSAALLMLLVIPDLPIRRSRKVMLMIVAAILGSWLLSRSEATMSRYIDTYVQSQPEGVYSPGAIFHLLLNLAPAVAMLLFRRKWSSIVPNWPLIRQLSLIAVILVPLVPFFSVAVGRMSLYLFPVSMTFVSHLPAVTEHPTSAASMRAVSIFALAAVLGLWLTFANTAFCYFPYQNVVFTESYQLELPY